MAKVLKLCLQCWRCAEGGLKNLPLRTLPISQPGDLVAMDLLGPLIKTPRSAIIVIVLIDHFTRWVFKKAGVSATVSCLCNSGCLRILYPLFFYLITGLTLRSPRCAIFAPVGVRKIYSTTYHPQGNSVVEILCASSEKTVIFSCPEREKLGSLFFCSRTCAYFIATCVYRVFALFPEAGP